MGQQCPQAKQRMRLPSRCSYRSPSRARESTTSRRVDISALPRILLAVLCFGVAPASCRHVCRAKTAGEMSAYSPARRRRYSGSRRNGMSGGTSDSPVIWVELVAHRSKLVARSSARSIAGFAVDQGRMLFQEVVGGFLNGLRLGARQLRSHKRHTNLAGLLAAGPCQKRPEVRLGHILGSAVSEPIIGAQSILRPHMTLLCCLQEPMQRRRVVLKHTRPGGVASGERNLLVGIAEFGTPANLIKPEGRLGHDRVPFDRRVRLRDGRDGYDLLSRVQLLHYPRGQQVG